MAKMIKKTGGIPFKLRNVVVGVGNDDVDNE